ncbi:hypothetical protein GIB67_016320 [Kingdonia uniflora]|uniref:RRM domain-containing protein n=1 Tax=Kingdonia uniflora TaxID=39325 RepID=A0A7J7M9S7_9MAGN|nr:hypothetical protein GIB67_016320 [Kingdonia uniflora]
MDEMTSYYPPPPPQPQPQPQPSSGLHHYNPPPPPSSYPYYPPQQQLPPIAQLPPQPYPYQQQHHPQDHPPSSYAPHHHQHPQPSQEDHVRTLFIAGLPEDVKPREIYNLFREFPGYQSSKLRTASEKSQPFGFAVFADQQSAIAAMEELNGLVFDLEKQSTLYIDLAKSNSRSKRSRTDDGGPGSFDKKSRGLDAFSRGPPDSGLGSNNHMPGMGNSAYNMIGYPSTQSHGFDSITFNDTEDTKMNPSRPYVPQNNTPCPTLFVANLGPTCTEQELNQVFSRWPGFLKLKMQSKRGAPVAFVDFQDDVSAVGALKGLQDTVLQSSCGEGIRLEYAKSRMGMRKKK